MKHLYTSLKLIAGAVAAAAVAVVGPSASAQTATTPSTFHSGPRGCQEAADCGDAANDLGSNPTVKGTLGEGGNNRAGGAVGQRGTVHLRSQQVRQLPGSVRRGCRKHPSAVLCGGVPCDEFFRQASR